jgi:hypothetical protein
MILTDNMKRLIDELNVYEPDLPNGFYSVNVLQRRLDFTAQFVLESLANDGLIRWGDKQHTAFWLLERARNYKNIEKLERIERWKERAIGFVCGILTSIVTGLISIALANAFK